MGFKAREILERREPCLEVVEGGADLSESETKGKGIAY